MEKQMKKLGILVALMALAAVPAFAQSVGPDNYHYNLNMNCSDCHSMHASAHELNSNPITTSEQAFNTWTPAADATTINPYYPALLTPQQYLLKSTDGCSSCHNGQTFAPDVVGADFNTGNYVRSAGGVNLPGGHQVGTAYAGATPPGYDNSLQNYWTDNGTTLHCYSCHSPHGSANYRNLVPFAMRTQADHVTPRVGYSTVIAPQFNKGAAVTGAITQDVVIKNGDYTFPHAASTFDGYYERANITYSQSGTHNFGAANSGTSNNRMDAFCATCHGAFHGGATTDTNVSSTIAGHTAFIRHPTGVVGVDSIGTGARAVAFANLKVYQADVSTVAVGDSPGCVSCHKAHGSNNPFGLIYPSSLAADTTESGGGIYKTLCKSCHGMGGSNMQ